MLPGRRARRQLAGDDPALSPLPELRVSRVSQPEFSAIWSPCTKTSPPDNGRRLQQSRLWSNRPWHIQFSVAAAAGLAPYTAEQQSSTCPLITETGIWPSSMGSRER